MHMSIGCVINIAYVVVAFLIETPHKMHHKKYYSLIIIIIKKIDLKNPRI